MFNRQQKVRDKAMKKSWNMKYNANKSDRVYEATAIFTKEKVMKNLLTEDGRSALFLILMAESDSMYSKVMCVLMEMGLKAEAKMVSKWREKALFGNLMPEEVKF